MVSQLAFVLFGVMVGTVISLDNIAAITVLASKHGTNIKLIVSEIWAHIVLELSKSTVYGTTKRAKSNFSYYSFLQ